MHIAKTSKGADSRAASSAPLNPEPPGKVLDEQFNPTPRAIQRNSHSRLHVGLNFGRGSPRIEIRQHDFDGRVFASTPKGLTLPAERLDDLIGGLLDLRKELLGGAR